MRQEINKNDPVKAATIVALGKLLAPIIELMFDTGVTVQEFSRIARDHAVRRAAARMYKDTGRESKSRVAILTGLPRSEVTRILKTTDRPASDHFGQHPIRKLLNGWHENPMFLAEGGAPMALPIFGPRPSFERLVTRYCGGLPVRAVLDQLVQINAVEVLTDQRVSVKSRVPYSIGLTSTALTEFGDRAGNLLGILQGNLRTPISFFEETAITSEVNAEAIDVLKPALAELAAVFFAGADSLVNRAGNRSPHSSSKSSSRTSRIGIVTYFFKSDLWNDALEIATISQDKRKNLIRKRGKKIKLRPGRKNG